MKTIIQGKNLKTTYEVDHKWKTIKNDKNEDITVYTGKPELTKKTEITSWSTIKEFNEVISCNKKNLYGEVVEICKINLSETEQVDVIDNIFRVDLGAYVLMVDKVLEEEVLLKEECEKVLNDQIREFNNMMIESNERLLAYCKLHNLLPEFTDVAELFKIVYPDCRYYIDDGKFKVVENDFCISSSSYGTFSIPYLEMNTGYITSGNTINKGRLVSSTR